MSGRAEPGKSNHPTRECEEIGTSRLQFVLPSLGLARPGREDALQAAPYRRLLRDALDVVHMQRPHAFEAKHGTRVVHATSTWDHQRTIRWSKTPSRFSRCRSRRRHGCDSTPALSSLSPWSPTPIRSRIGPPRELQSAPNEAGCCQVPSP